MPATPIDSTAAALGPADPQASGAGELPAKAAGLTDVRTGSAYESARAAIRSGLAVGAGNRRVSLGNDLVLVFETRETVRSALEEMLRAERVADPDRIAAEVAAFEALLAGERELAATLYVDIADQAALADRLTELAGIGSAVALEVSGDRVAARSDGADQGSGALRLVFAFDEAQRAAVLEGRPVAVVVDHAGCRAAVTLGGEQSAVIAAGLQR